MFLPPSLRLTHARPSVPLTRVPIPASAGCPDWQSGEKKDLKWRVICQGVEKLIKKRGLKAKDVMLWVDWQSIYQDDKAEKLKGVMSLIKVCPPHPVHAERLASPPPFSPPSAVRHAVRVHAGADRAGEASQVSGGDQGLRRARLVQVRSGGAEEGCLGF